MAGSDKPRALEVRPDDPLAADLNRIGRWIEDAAEFRGDNQYYTEIDLKQIPNGATLTAGNPEQSKRVVLAAVALTHHFDRLADEIRNQATSEFERMNAHLLPGWNSVWGRRRLAEAIVKTLMRRSLPFDKADLITILDWTCDAQALSSYYAPIGQITRALQRYAASHEVNTELREWIGKFGAKLHAATEKETKRLGTVVSQLCACDQTDIPDDDEATVHQAPPQPAPAGMNGVLVPLKQLFGMLPDEPAATTTLLEPDLFPLRDDSPLRQDHQTLSSLFSAVVGTPQYSTPNMYRMKDGKTLLGLGEDAIGYAVLAAAERHVNSLLNPKMDYADHAVWQSRYAACAVAEQLLKCSMKLGRLETFDVLLYASVLPEHLRPAITELAGQLVARARDAAKEAPLTEGERFVLSLFRASQIAGPLLGTSSDEIKVLTDLINDGASFYLVPGEVWTDAVNNEVGQMPVASKSCWAEFFKHALTATSPRPSDKWLKRAKSLVEAIGSNPFRDAISRWLPLVGRGQSTAKLGSYAGDTRGGSDTMQAENANCLRGLLWTIPLLPNPNDLARAISAIALSAYKKVPGVGPRAVKVGNAAVFALSQLASEEAVGQLAMLKVRVKFGTAQKEIEKAFDSASAALGLPRDQIEELGVPSYGMEDVGRRVDFIGSYRAEIEVTGSDASLKWFDANGKALKSVPAKVKSEFKEELKDLQQSLKDIHSMLPAQRDRIDGMFLLEKSWPIAVWQERYHDHPLVGTIARRLIWCLDGTAALFIDGAATDVIGNPIEHGKTAEITLWHPVGRAVEETVAWRRRLETLEITQPFKQAYREVYLLTDAERRTRTYSNRFAAHIIRQHQFNALCAARGWKNRLRLMVDDTYAPPGKELASGIRAEFWVEGIGQDYGTDTNESGVYLRLSTDQVRFYRSEAAGNYAHAAGGGYASGATGPGDDGINEPLPLEAIPALVFSEIMRDVDLFVGVASVGNDPTWQDGGPEGRFREYWNNYSFGELSGTAATRKQALERLVPRLKIASRCTFSDRFLVVRGELRTYKIHFGSGNILMEPNDQYLCIVPDARARSNPDDLYLPFEGDATLSIIISKAILLAEDRKIKDPSITRQIASGG